MPTVKKHTGSVSIKVLNTPHPQFQIQTPLIQNVHQDSSSVSSPQDKHTCYSCHQRGSAQFGQLSYAQHTIKPSTLASLLITIYKAFDSQGNRRHRTCERSLIQ